MTTPTNLPADFNQLLSRVDKEKLLNQNAKVIWLIGLSCAGKTTLATCEKRDTMGLNKMAANDNIR
jgi:adenylylsulfate kinase-like enzyme